MEINYFGFYIVNKYYTGPLMTDYANKIGVLTRELNNSFIENKDFNLLFNFDLFLFLI